MYGGHPVGPESSGSATTDAGDLTSGVLAHEQGGLEADVSAYSGLVKIAGGATSVATSGTDYLIPREVQNTLTAGATQTQGQAAITPATSGTNEIVARYTTVATTGDVATLPSASGDDLTVNTVAIYNRGANSMDVYPASGGTLWVDGAALSADTATSVAAASSLTFVRITSTIWEAI